MVNRNFLAPCGLYCGVCGVYYATRDKNDKFMQKLVGVYEGKIATEIKKEDLACEGCMSDNVSLFCRVCAIKACTRETNLNGTVFRCQGFRGSCFVCPRIPRVLAEIFIVFH